MIKLQHFLLMVFTLFALLFLSLTGSVQWSSPLRQFNVTPDTILLNWTNSYASNITITVNDTFNNITVRILNGTAVSANYSQSNNQNDCTSDYKLHVINVNASNSYNNTIGPIAKGNTSIATIIDNVNYDHRRCEPGRYWIEKFTIRNNTRINETANITVFIDIPISSLTPNNANLPTTGVGTFGDTGDKLPGNASNYHSYFFNTSSVTNATGVLINLSGWASSQDIDLFLFDNSSTPVLKAKSINKTHANESLLYNYFPSTWKMWEIRIYGNDTSTISYNGKIVFTTLNTSNSSIDFGVMNASDAKQVNITLKNEGNLTLSNIMESKELYHINEFSGSSTKNFTFIVPDSSIATRVKASLNWTGSSNYSLNIYNPSGVLMAKSTNKYFNANMTGAMQEEYNETTSISAGVWKVEAKNNTATTNPYTITVYTYVSPSDWISTNYTTTTINRTGLDVQINITVQNNTMNGLYKGNILYLNRNHVGIKIPISINVTTPMLVVNDTINSVTIKVDENIGANLTRHLITYVNNTGVYDLNLVLTNSSNNKMSCVSGTGCTSGYFADFTYNSTSSLVSRSSDVLSINMTYNSSMPSGVYEGWILFNATNSTTALASHPYETFNLTLRLNLTTTLDIQTHEIVSFSDGDPIVGKNSPENTTVRCKIYYINGTEIEAGNALNTTNFTVWLTHINVTTHRIPSSGGLSLYNGTNPIYPAGTKVYSVNFTVPSNSPGGYYTTNIQANYNRNPSFSGTGINQTLSINNTGLKLAAVTTTSFTFTEGGSARYLNISTVNYGPLNPDGSLTMDSWANATITAHWRNNTNCSASPSGRSFPFTASESANTVNGNGTEHCMFSWKIVPNNVADDTWVNNLKITSTDQNFGNITGIYIRVNDNTTATTTTPSSSSSSTSGGGGDAGDSGQPSGTTNYIDIIDYPSSVSVEQGGSKKVGVTVNNTNKTLTQNVILSITGMNSSWYSVKPSTSVKLKRAETYSFEVTFDIPGNATVGDHSAKFNATSFYQFKTVTKIYDTALKSFTLKVTPGTALQAEIKSDLVNFTNEMNNLETQINQSKDQGYNTTEVESLLSQLKTKINQANDYVDKGNYASAYDLLDDIEDLINQIKDDLTELPITGKFGGIMKDWWNWGKWVIIIVVVAVVAILGYMLWPTKFGEPKPTPKEVVKKVVVEKKDKVAETFMKLRERWKKIKEKEEPPKNEP